VAQVVEHYNLEAILAVGYRVRSARGTAFRQWATAWLAEYLVKGFVMDDERLKNPPGPRAHLTCSAGKGASEISTGIPRACPVDRYVLCYGSMKRETPWDKPVVSALEQNSQWSC
jgi:hypothetical protein